MPSAPAKTVRLPRRWPTTNRTMRSPDTAITAFLPIESENSFMSVPSQVNGGHRRGAAGMGTTARQCTPRGHPREPGDESGAMRATTRWSDQGDDQGDQGERAL